MRGCKDQKRADAKMHLGRRASGDEQSAPQGIPADVREFIVAKLAEMLVLDVEQYPVVSAPTVVEGRVSHRTIRRVESRTQAD